MQRGGKEWECSLGNIVRLPLSGKMGTNAQFACRCLDSAQCVIIFVLVKH